MGPVSEGVGCATIYRQQNHSTGLGREQQLGAQFNFVCWRAGSELVVFLIKAGPQSEGARDAGGGAVPCIRGRWSGQGRTAVVVELIDKVARVVRDSMWSLWCPLANRFELIGATREMFSFCCYPPTKKRKKKETSWPSIVHLAKVILPDAKVTSSGILPGWRMELCQLSRWQK